MASYKNTYKNVEESQVDTAIIPVGATEQHGPHLPLGVDWMLANAVAQGVGEKLNAYVLPAMPFGASQAHKGFPGSVWLEHNTLAAVVRDLAHCLMEQGFRRLIILNMHGGNVVLKVAVRDLNFNHPDCRVLLVFPQAVATKDLVGVIENITVEGHAGEFETSMMLHLHPDLVQGPGPDCLPDVPPDFLDYLPMQLATPTGVWGRASFATTAKGERAFKIVVDKTAAMIAASFQRLDEIAQKR